jgi:hypothetical protein
MSKLNAGSTILRMDELNDSKREDDQFWNYLVHFFTDVATQNFWHISHFV